MKNPITGPFEPERGLVDIVKYDGDLIVKWNPEEFASWRAAQRTVRQLKARGFYVDPTKEFARPNFELILDDNIARAAKFENLEIILETLARYVGVDLVRDRGYVGARGYAGGKWEASIMPFHRVHCSIAYLGHHVSNPIKAVRQAIKSWNKAGRPL